MAKHSEFKWSASVIERLLYSKYVENAGPGEYAYWSEITKSERGQRDRRIDALALSTWKSRGIELQGFEIKVNKYDLRGELKDPTKADMFGKYCDRWWLVFPEALLEEEELVSLIPAAWGIMVGKMHAGKPCLKTHRNATRLPDPKPLDKVFISHLTRRLTADMVPRGIVDAKVKERLEASVKHAVDCALQEQGVPSSNELLIRSKRLDKLEGILQDLLGFESWQDILSEKQLPELKRRLSMLKRVLRGSFDGEKPGDYNFYAPIGPVSNGLTESFKKLCDRLQDMAEFVAELRAFEDAAAKASDKVIKGS